MSWSNLQDNLDQHKFLISEEWSVYVMELLGFHGKFLWPFYILSDTLMLSCPDAFCICKKCIFGTLGYKSFGIVVDKIDKNL